MITKQCYSRNRGIIRKSTKSILSVNLSQTLKSLGFCPTCKVTQPDSLTDVGKVGKYPTFGSIHKTPGPWVKNNLFF